MLEYEELILKLSEYSDKLEHLKASLGLEKMLAEIHTLEKQSAAEDFWGDLANSQKVLQSISMLKNKVEKYQALKVPSTMR
jgi:peptide chain release factor 2